MYRNGSSSAFHARSAEGEGTGIEINSGGVEVGQRLLGAEAEEPLSVMW